MRVKTKRKILEYIALAAFFTPLLFIEGVDMETITIKQFLEIAAISLSICVACLYKAGDFRR